ncbi:uncharacterized protein LOC135345705 isoform X1 [Halichondria panicea]|uniref:uncharacterized protein LOC135345705 isoform X1 n=1 Tax=Halichondria panicea TaxID=6063 RepID=UPI00312B9D22
MASHSNQQEEQRVFVIRHGERIDHVDYSWVGKSDRPYDPPLTEQGVREAKDAGCMLKERSTLELQTCLLSSLSSSNTLAWGPIYFQDIVINTVISSPFLRCLQTAQHICDGLQLPGIMTCNGIVDVLTPSFGILQQPVVPADNIAELGIKVLTFHQEPIPTFPEYFRDGMKRYSAEINKLADEHWPKNIVIVTHMFCVTQAIALTGDQVSFTDYCGYVEMSRSSKQKYDWKKVKTFGIEE